MTTYYEILGLSEDAFPDLIKRAFRREALKWHPDKNSSPGAREKFMTVYEAYEILSDPWKKKIYDERLRALKPGTADPDWVRKARRHASDAAEIRLHELFKTLGLDLRTFFFGAALPDATVLVTSLFKTFSLVTVLLFITILPSLARAFFSVAPAFLVTTLQLKASDLPTIELLIQTVTAILVLILFIATFVVTGSDLPGTASRIFGLFFQVDDEFVPIGWIVIGIIISTFSWACFLAH